MTVETQIQEIRKALFALGVAVDRIGKVTEDLMKDRTPSVTDKAAVADARSDGAEVARRFA